MAWYLNRALTGFRNAVNAAYPTRDKESDGTIGDAAHQTGSSDHNPDTDGSVDAWDMDVDLKSGNDPAAVEALKRVFQAHVSSKYWIHNDVIARRVDGWRRRPYSDFNDDPNRNKHTRHVHWNTREEGEDSTAPWNVEDDVTPEQAQQLRDSHFTLAKAINNPAGAGTVPLHVWAEWMTVMMKAVAADADIEPADLERIEAAARTGAAEGVAAAADSLAAAIVARLPETGTLTIGAVEVAVKEGVRAVLGSLDE